MLTPIQFNGRGMGAVWVIGSDGKPFNCDNWSGLTEGACWNPFEWTFSQQAVTQPDGSVVYQPVTPDKVQDSPLASIPWGTIAILAGLGLGGAVVLGTVLGKVI